MTHTEQAQYIGKTGAVAYDGMEFRVKVIDVRQRWGDTQVLLLPLWWEDYDAHPNDHGAAWKSTASVHFGK